MADNTTILVGTVGEGVMRSADNGNTWKRMGYPEGLHTDALVRALVSDRDRPEVVLAGTDRGLYRSDDAGQSWRLVDSALSGYNVWALAVDPQDPQTMYAGTGIPTPAGLFRSRDRGVTWEKRPMKASEEDRNFGIPRVTGIAVDPVNRGNIWVGLEVDGVRYSRDGGDTWMSTDGNGAIRPPDEQNVVPDVHNVGVAGGPPKTVFVVTNNEVYTSTDDGEKWNSLGISEVFPLTFVRGIAVQPGSPNVIFITIGDANPGRTGAVMRSKDSGLTWERLPLPVEPNSAIWMVNIQPVDPKVVFAGSRYGYLYRSDDGGDSWTKLWREFSEISSVVWIPS